MKEQLQKPQPSSRLRQRAIEEVKLLLKERPSHFLRAGCYWAGALSTQQSESMAKSKHQPSICKTPPLPPNSRDVWLSSLPKNKCFPNQLLLRWSATLNQREHPLERGGWLTERPPASPAAAPRTPARPRETEVSQGEAFKT